MSSCRELVNESRAKSKWEEKKKKKRRKSMGLKVRPSISHAIVVPSSSSSSSKSSHHVETSQPSVPTRLSIKAGIFNHQSP